jgi:Tfp pilus assembly protein PilO
MKLQPSEKRLLMILAVVAILALSFQYLILPELKKGQELSDRNKSLSLAYNLITNKNGEASAIEKEYSQAKKMLEVIIEKDLSNNLSYEELDQYFTKMAIRNGLKPTALIIENPKDINKEAIEYEYIKEVYVTLDVTGSMDQLFSLMNEIDGEGFLKIEYINSVNDDKTYNHNIKISIVMLKG